LDFYPAASLKNNAFPPLRSGWVLALSIGEKSINDPKRRRLTVTQEILKIAEDYLDAVNEQDIEALGKNLHPLLHFKAALCEIDGRQNFLEHTEKFFSSIKGLEIRARFASASQTFFLYDLFFNNSLGMSRTANLMTFENGMITEMELVYDPRPFEHFFKDKETAAQKVLVDHLKF
jgi:hypothetical protein